MREPLKIKLLRWYLRAFSGGHFESDGVVVTGRFKGHRVRPEGWEPEPREHGPLGDAELRHIARRITDEE